jgi:hypothetical protein
MINYLALLIALVLSSVAGWYSIIGLTAIFSASFWPIVIMGTTLEVGKVVTTAWLHRNWKVAPRGIRYYLTASVVVLMFITSMGIFGFLSKAHIEQTINTSDNSVMIQQLESKIERENKKISDAEIVIQQLDNTIKVLQDAQRLRGEDGAIAVRERQKEERDQLQSVIDNSMKSIDELQAQKTDLEVQQTKLEAEVGPLKYIADLIYSGADDNQLESAVRWVIIVLVFVFDPLAILLLIAANIGLQNQKTTIQVVETPPVPVKRKRGRPRKNTVEINKTSIMKLK